MHEGCFLTCYLQEKKIQLSEVVSCSKPLDCCQRKVKSSFDDQLRKLKKQREVSLQSCWEIGTLSKMKRPSWTSRIPSEIVFSSLCCTIFARTFFVAFVGRHLSNSRIKEVFEVNVKFVATWLRQWKKKWWRKLLASVTHFLISDMECPKKEKVTMRGAVNQFFHFQNRLHTIKN